MQVREQFAVRKVTGRGTQRRVQVVGGLPGPLVLAVPSDFARQAYFYQFRLGTKDAK